MSWRGIVRTLVHLEFHMNKKVNINDMILHNQDTVAF